MMKNKLEKKQPAHVDCTVYGLEKPFGSWPKHVLRQCGCNIFPYFIGDYSIGVPDWAQWPYEFMCFFFTFTTHRILYEVFVLCEIENVWELSPLEQWFQ